MLWNASAMTGYKIEARDGQIGTVSDLLFEEVGWAIRWLVVDTGDWFPGRKVLLPLSALGQPDPALRQFPIKLTMAQIKASPGTDWDQPVSRQLEARIYDHYAALPYWDSDLPGGLNVNTVFAGTSGHIGLLLAAGSDGIGQPIGHGDPHLRSIAEVTGYAIEATDGMIGHVEDLQMETDSWQVRYVLVKTGNWWPGEKVLISPQSVELIDWVQETIHLGVTRQKVKDSPPYVPTTTVDGAYDESFLTYYGIKWVGRAAPPAAALIG
jgi:sporulation protein YlmC with PRC-barrel domain